MNRDTAQEVRAFIRSLLDELGDRKPFGDAEALFENARLDSMALMQLTIWLEQHYAIDFAQLELHLGHFESVDGILRLIERDAEAKVLAGRQADSLPAEKGIAASWQGPAGYLLLALLAVVGLHFVAAWLGVSPVRNDGHWDMLWDVDSYVWVHWVQQLADGAAWSDRWLERINAPYGYQSHWTLPYAVVLYAGASLGSWFTDFDTALWGWAVSNGVLTHIAIFALLAWAVRHQLSGYRALLFLAMFLSLRGIFHQTAIGQADHHGLLLLLESTGLVLLLSLCRESRPLLALMLGLTGALAVWVSVEGLLVVAAIFAALWLLWLSDRQRSTRSLEYASLGLLMGLGSALLIERPLSDLLTVEYDRLSVAHLQLAALIWAGCLLLGTWRQRCQTAPSLKSAVAVSTVAGTGLIGVFLMLFPAFWDGPHPWLGGAVWQVVEGIQDEQPYLPNNPYNALGFVIDLTPLWLALGFCCWRLWRGQGTEIDRRLLVNLAFLVVFAAFTLMRFRGLGYLHVALLLPWFWLVLTLVERYRKKAGRGTAAGLLVAAIAGHWVLALPVWSHYFPNGEIDWGIRRTPECRLSQLGAYLPPPPGSEAPATVLTTVFSSGQLLLNSTLGIINAPYHRNVEGIEDGLQLWWGDPAEVASKMVAQKRRLAYVAVCNSYLNELPNVWLNERPNSLMARLADNRPPEWLREVALPAHLSDQARLYRVDWGR